MQTKCCLPSICLAVAVLLSGCDKQTRANTEKIAQLSQKLVALQATQSSQLTQLQAQINSLGPLLDKINGSYFEKTHENAFSYHTNTLYLLLLVDRQIESELKTAAAERQAEHDLANSYHTNLTRALTFCTAEIEDALAVQAGLLETNVNAATRRISAELAAQLIKQIQLTVPDAAEIARRRQLAADLAQIKSDLAQIKAQLGSTNRP